MSTAVVLVGPTTVRGPGEVDLDVAATALDCIDDDLALVDDQAIPVARLWSEVMGRLIGTGSRGVVVICPSWWPGARVATVEAAARTWSANVRLRRRSDVLAAAGAVVEIAEELVVLRAAGRRDVVPRTGAAASVVDAVAACLAGLDAVTVDAPTGEARFAAEIAKELRRNGIEVSTVGDRELVEAAHVHRSSRCTAWRGAVTPRAAALVGVAVVVVGLCVAAFRIPSQPQAVGDLTWVVEGRVAVEVPADWTVERITSGPGSARVQVLSPEGAEAVHVTQARVRDQTIEATAEALRVALAGEADGVFVDFSATDRRADRPAVTYREIRRDRVVSWAVVLDRGVRIAIGCQGSVALESVCEHAIRSARTIG